MIHYEFSLPSPSTPMLLYQALCQLVGNITIPVAIIYAITQLL